MTRRMQASPDLPSVLLAAAERADHIWQLPSQQLVDATESKLTEIRKAEQSAIQVLSRIIDEHGWPGVRLVGIEGARAAWLLALRADRFPRAQERFLHRLKEAARRGDAEWSWWAHLYDRVCVQRGTPQSYGTQHILTGNRLVPHPVADAEELDARRKTVGLPPYERATSGLKTRARRARAVGTC